MTTAVSAARTTTTEAPTAPDGRLWDVGAVVAVNAVIVVGLWLRHGGMHTLAETGGAYTAVGQLTGLVGTYAVLVQVLLMSRLSWVERFVGLDRLAGWHRWTGFAAVTLLVSHAVFITLGYAASAHFGIGHQIGDFIRHYPDVLMSIVGLALFLAVAVTSVRAARRKLSRESWYSVHLYAYLAIALSFAHQLAVGSDFTDDAVARAWWVLLYAAVFGSILGWRVVRPLWFNARHRLRVEAVREEADGVVSIYITGRRLDAVKAESGQFFLWRFLTGFGWAKAHPYSLSAAPNGRFLRITVKALGDDSSRLQRIAPGVRVFAEGPYGAFTARRRARRRVALIAGGIGITPLRALVETLPAGDGDLTLLYRVATERDVAFRRELDKLAQSRGSDVQLLVGTDIGDDRTDQLSIPALRRLVPDIASRDVFVCGPPAMLTALTRRLRALRVPKRQVHFERFEL
jgi:predicted ferric reductase